MITRRDFLSWKEKRRSRIKLKVMKEKSFHDEMYFNQNDFISEPAKPKRLLHNFFPTPSQKKQKKNGLAAVSLKALMKGDVSEYKITSLDKSRPQKK